MCSLASSELHLVDAAFESFLGGRDSLVFDVLGCDECKLRCFVLLEASVGGPRFGLGSFVGHVLCEA